MTWVKNSIEVDTILSDALYLDLSPCGHCEGEAVVEADDRSLSTSLEHCRCGETVAEFRKSSSASFWVRCDRDRNPIWLNGSLVSTLLDKAFTAGLQAAERDLEMSMHRREGKG